MSSDAKPVGFCRACGKALDETNVRSAHGTLYCEEHVPMENAFNVAPPIPAAGPSVARIEPPSPYSAAFANAPTLNPDVSPGLAFGLGIIPGVGAIYNGQYAKGLYHIVIFGLMISLLDSGKLHHLEAMMSLLLAGFCAYMPFEAYHTAKRRLVGQNVDEFSSLFPMRGPAARFPVAPVLLIVLGGLFLLSNFDMLDIDRLLNFWPALLIALGVYMLWVRYSPDTTVDKEASHGQQ